MIKKIDMNSDIEFAGVYMLCTHMNLLGISQMGNVRIANAQNIRKLVYSLIKNGISYVKKKE